MWNFYFPSHSEEREGMFQSLPHQRAGPSSARARAHARSLLLTLTCQLSSLTALQRCCSSDLNLPAPSLSNNTPCYYLAAELLFSSSPLMNNECEAIFGCSAPISCADLTNTRRTFCSLAEIWISRWTCVGFTSKGWEEEQIKLQQHKSWADLRQNKLNVRSRFIPCNLKRPSGLHEKLITSGRNFETFIL